MAEITEAQLAKAAEKLEAARANATSDPDAYRKASSEYAELRSAHREQEVAAGRRAGGPGTAQPDAVAAGVATPSGG